MSARIVFPDSLFWESGTELGLYAVFHARKELDIDVTVLVERTGDRTEAVGFAVFQLGLEDCVDFFSGAERLITSRDIVILPRLKRNHGRHPSFFHKCRLVLSSEPGEWDQVPTIRAFLRWDVHGLTRAICEALEGEVGAS